MTEELKPCPFCGGKNIDPTFWSRNDGTVGPGCDDCSATADSTEAWNKRQVVASAQREPAAFQYRQRSGIGKGPQCSLPWGDWCEIGRETYEQYLKQPNKLVQVRALYADAPAEGEPADEYFDMLWAWFEQRGAIVRADYSEGFSADDFKTMLDEHEAALSDQSPAASAEGQPSELQLALAEEKAKHALTLQELERRSPAASVDLDYKLPCPVQVPPATMIGKGCKLSTLIESIRQREGKNAGFAFPSQPATSPAALEPFARFAEQNTDENGWRSNIHRESISTWFGPSEFRALLALRSQPEIVDHKVVLKECGWSDTVANAGFVKALLRNYNVTRKSAVTSTKSTG